MSEISRLNFININAYKFGQPAILASKHCSLLTASRGVDYWNTIYLLFLVSTPYRKYARSTWSKRTNSSTKAIKRSTAARTRFREAARRDVATPRKFAKTVKGVTAKLTKTARGDAATRRKP